MFEKDSQTIGSILNEMYRIVALDQPQREVEAEKFVQAYTNWTAESMGEGIEKARAVVGHNLGYLSGYCDDDTRRLMQGTFHAAHPVFGAW